MKRLFAAIHVSPDPPFLRHLGELRQILHRDRINWVNNENIHITLKFFGETREQDIPDISQILANLAAETACFSIRLTNLGIFGSTYRPRVIWVGIQPGDPMTTLMKKSLPAFTTLGFPVEQQPLIPHATIGRIKELSDKQWFSKTLTRFHAIQSEKIAVSEITLFESILHQKGPQYIPLGLFPLKTTSLASESGQG